MSRSTRVTRPLDRLHDLGGRQEHSEGFSVERRTLLWLPAAAAGLAACRPTPSVPSSSPEPEPEPALAPLRFEAFVAKWQALTAEVDPSGRSLDRYLYALASLAARIEEVPPTQMKPSKSLGPSVEFGETYREAALVATQWRLRRGAELRPHNHPPFSGVTLGLEGQCRIRTYRAVSADASPRQGGEPFMVERVADEQCVPGRVVSRVSLRTNIHETLPVTEDTRGVDLYATLGDRNDFSGLIIEADADAEPDRFTAQWS